jgi:hypothetical protein
MSGCSSCTCLADQQPKSSAAWTHAVASRVAWGLRNAWTETHEALDVLSGASASSRRTRKPAMRRWYAVASPTTPPPTTKANRSVVSRVGDRLSGASDGTLACSTSAATRKFCCRNAAVYETAATPTPAPKPTAAFSMSAARPSEADRRAAALCVQQEGSTPVRVAWPKSCNFFLQSCMQLLVTLHSPRIPKHGALMVMRWWSVTVTAVALAGMGCSVGATATSLPQFGLWLDSEADEGNPSRSANHAVCSLHGSHGLRLVAC